jgi:uncharacterized protein YecT (DUF1311 family)
MHYYGERKLAVHTSRAFSDPIASDRRSKSLFCRIFATQSGVHFAGKCSNGLRALLFCSVLFAGVASSALVAQRALAEEEPKVDCANAQATYELNFCANKDFEKADAELNKVYKQALAHVGESAGTAPYDRKSWEAALRASQRTWVAFRDADCKDLTAMEWQGGTGGTAAELGCMTQLTSARAKDLRDRYVETR